MSPASVTAPRAAAWGAPPSFFGMLSALSVHRLFQGLRPDGAVRRAPAIRDRHRGGLFASPAAALALNPSARACSKRLEHDRALAHPLRPRLRYPADGNCALGPGGFIVWIGSSAVLIASATARCTGVQGLFEKIRFITEVDPQVITTVGRPFAACETLRLSALR